MLKTDGPDGSKVGHDYQRREPDTQQDLHPSDPHPCRSSWTARAAARLSWMPRAYSTATDPSHRHTTNSTRVTSKTEPPMPEDRTHSPRHA